MARSKTNEAAKATNRDPKPGEKRPIEIEAEEIDSPKRPKLQERTDYSRWRLLDERGRQTWHYLEDDEDGEEWPQSTADKYFLGLPTVRTAFQLCNALLANY
jgi:lanosterol synthase